MAYTLVSASGQASRITGLREWRAPDDGSFDEFLAALAVLDSLRAQRSRQLPEIPQWDKSLARVESLIVTSVAGNIHVAGYLPPWRRTRDGEDAEEDEIERAKLRCAAWLLERLRVSETEVADAGSGAESGNAASRQLARAFDQAGGADAVSLLVAILSERADARDKGIDEELEVVLADVDRRLARGLVTPEDYALLPLKDEILLALAKREVRRSGRAAVTPRILQSFWFDGTREHLAKFIEDR